MVAFTASSVLTAAALNTAFNAYTVNAQTGTTYTFVLTDHGGLVTASNASSSTYTVPPNASVAFAVGDRIGILNIGAGTVTLAPGAGVTVNASSLNISQYGGGTLVKTATNTWYFVAGGSPKASVSSTSGSPTTGANGSKTYYKWTGSGSVTIGTAGLCEILVVGGGAGGGTGGGGGGGGHLTTTTAYLPAGTHTVTVGAGGTGGSGGAAGVQGNTSALGPYYATGGGNQNSGTNTAGLAGGSGGGGRGSGAGGSGVTGLGSAGGTGGTDPTGGGGGGSAAVGSNGSGATGGAGGTGTSSSLDGAATTRSGGGGGGGTTTGGSATGGGGAGGTTTGTAGTANTGGGGGGASVTGFVAGNGGSGIVILLIG